MDQVSAVKTNFNAFTQCIAKGENTQYTHRTFLSAQQLIRLKLFAKNAC